MRGAYRLVDAAELLQVVAKVDDVEAAPLVGAQRSEEEVGGGALHAEAVTAVVEEMVHPIHLLAENFEQFAPVEGRPGKLAGTRKGRRGRAAGHVAAREHDNLQQTLQCGAARVCGSAALKARLQHAAGAAANKHEMLNEVLRAPVPAIVAGMQLAPLRRLVNQGTGIRLVHFLKNGMHDRDHRQGGGLLGETISFTSCHTTAIRCPALGLPRC